MKSEKLIEFIRHPEKVTSEDLRELNDLVYRYPYFQTARILYLKALHLKAGARFRNELKQHTVHITDHKQFFRYLNQQLLFETSSQPSNHTELNEIVDERLREINGHLEVTSPGIPAYPQGTDHNKPTEEDNISLNIPQPETNRPTPPRSMQRPTNNRIRPEDTNVISNPIRLDDIPGMVSDYSESPSEPLPRIFAPDTEIPAATLPNLSGIPGMISEEIPETSPSSPVENFPALSMDIDLDDETVSIPPPSKPEPILDTPEIASAAYQLPVENAPDTTIQTTTGKNKRKKKNQLVEQFIQTAPVMPKISATTDTRDLSKENPFSPDDLFSETLAKIYVRQHLYQKAIATYIKLSLKYPEKSVYFADRIEQIKQNINNQE